MSKSQNTQIEEHFQVHDSAWSNDLTVEVGGHGVVSHAGSAVLRLLADRTGLTGALSRAMRRARVHPGARSGPGAGRCRGVHRRRPVSLTGPANLLLEAIGGVALILGLAVPAVGVLIALNMLGAWVLVHPTALYAADHTGPETVIAIGLLSLVLAATRSGRFGLDQLIASHRRVRRATSAAPTSID